MSAMLNKFNIFLFLIVLLTSCGIKTSTDITNEDLKIHMDYLASDSLKGRYPGTAEDSLLLDYLSGQFKSYGLKSFSPGYLQKFEILSGVVPSESNLLRYHDISYVQGIDYYPMSFSGDGIFSGEIEFCGYGYDLVHEGKNVRNDYQSRNIEGHWVIILMGEPGSDPMYSGRSDERDKAMLAREKGASGVIFIAGKDFSPQDRPDTVIRHVPDVGIPVLHVSRHAADKILKPAGYTVNKLEQLCREDSNLSLNLDGILKADISLNKTKTVTANVLGYLEGKNDSCREWIIIGAHHDHLGMGGIGSSSRAPDTIAVHNGADDNASGVVAVLELAEYFSSPANRPDHNLLFMTFGAEEKGLLGSRYFVEHPEVDLSSVMAMLNMDMLGRMQADSGLQIGGVGTTEISRDLVKKVNHGYHFNLSLSDAGYGPSDHSSFYLKDIPVLFFSTGAHSDYHTPFDDIDSINFNGLRGATEFIASCLQSLDSLKTPPAFRESGVKVNTSRKHRSKITMGIMPDVSGDTGEGLKVLAVTRGRPADIGGLKKGDVITAIDSKSISNVYDYMYLMNTFASGQSIVVTVKRNNDLLNLLVQL